MNKVNDENNLDQVYEDSVFSITEDAQYPLFDAEKAKEGILGKTKPKISKKLIRPVQPATDKEGAIVKRVDSGQSMKLGDFPETSFNLEEPLRLNSGKTDKSVASVNRTTSGMSSRLGVLPNTGVSRLGGMTRKIQGFRPTPMKGCPSPKKQIKDEKDLSPRSKMMPDLAKKVNSLTSKGCFSKVVPRSSPLQNTCTADSLDGQASVKPADRQTRFGSLQNSAKQQNVFMNRLGGKAVQRFRPNEGSTVKQDVHKPIIQPISTLIEKVPVVQPTKIESPVDLAPKVQPE